jgi:hypothetical protein
VRGGQRYGEAQLTRAGIAALGVQLRGQPARGRPASRRPEQPAHATRPAHPAASAARRRREGAWRSDIPSCLLQRRNQLLDFEHLDGLLLLGAGVGLRHGGRCRLLARGSGRGLRAAATTGWMIGQAAVLPRSAKLDLACCNPSTRNSSCRKCACSGGHLVVHSTMAARQLPRLHTPGNAPGASPTPHQ